MTEGARIIDLPKIEDERGNLTFFESKHLPFEIKRNYWIYDVPSAKDREGHAFKSQSEFIVALSGSLNVTIHDGKKETVFHLSRSNYGLYVPKKTWRIMTDFSTNAVVLVSSSTHYDTDDYIREFDQFLKLHP